MTRFDDAIAYLRRNVQELHELRKEFPNRWTDEEIAERMFGHPRWDDPPKGYSTNPIAPGYDRLIQWSRGYLKGRSTQAGNDAGLIEFGLHGIAPEQDENIQNWYKPRNQKFVREYAFRLQRELDEYIQKESDDAKDFDSQIRHAVQVIASPSLTVATVEFVRRDRFESWLETASYSGFKIFRDIGNQAIAHQYSEQPLKRELGVYLRERENEQMALQVCHPSYVHFWSNVQAWEDSNDAIALMLTRKR